MNLLDLPIILFCRKFPGKSRDNSFGLIQRFKVDNLLKNKDWLGLENSVNSLAESELTRLLDGLCLSDDYHSELTEYIKTNSSETRDLIAGIYFTHLAWKSRSGALAKHLNEEQIQGFFEYLEMADETLPIHSNQINIKQEALARMIRVDLGLSRKEEAGVHFAECIKTSANHLAAHFGYFRVLTWRWLGSDEELLAFSSSPSDPAMKSLLGLMYLVETRADLDMQEENDEIPDDVIDRNFKQDNEEAIREIYDNIHIPEGDSLETILAKNYLAYFYTIMGWKNKRNATLNQLKNRITMHPWIYAGIMTERDLKVFKFCGLI